ncbi:MAG: hypothetical protein J5755_05460 [Clostridia bacterium]|nr:hypothetical protein [Clostridia bacterium]
MNSLLSANQYIQSSGIVTVYLLLIVFAVLGVLVVVLTLGQRGLGVVTKCTDAVKAKLKAAKDKRLARKAPPQPPIEDAPLAIEAGISPEVVAAIMAAVSCCMQAEVPAKKANFVVKKIVRR